MGNHARWTGDLWLSPSSTCAHNYSVKVSCHYYSTCSVQNVPLKKYFPRNGPLTGNFSQLYLTFGTQSPSRLRWKRLSWEICCREVYPIWRTEQAKRTALFYLGFWCIQITHFLQRKCSKWSHQSLCSSLHIRQSRIRSNVSGVPRTICTEPCTRRQSSSWDSTFVA
jgi:hypothetical protein